MKTERFPSGKLVFSEGDPGSEAFRILQGSVEISIREGSHKVVLAKLGAGEIFGEMAMIEQRPRSASVRALEELEVEVITREDFSATLEDSGEALVPYLTGIFERLRVTNERLRSALKQLEELGAGRRMHLAEAKAVQEGPTVEIRPDSEETAAQSALKAKTVRHFPFLIGRRGEVAGVGLFADNQLLVMDRSPYRVSRNHCLIDYEAGSFFVRDKGSKLGTIVNGIGIGGPYPEKSARLSPGENSIVLGGPESQVRFEIKV